MNTTGSRLINEKHLINARKEILENAFVVFYADTNTSFLYDGSGLDEYERIAFIKDLIREVQSGCNYSREIIAQSKNVYFVY